MYFDGGEGNQLEKDQDQVEIINGEKDIDYDILKSDVMEKKSKSISRPPKNPTKIKQTEQDKFTNNLSHEYSDNAEINDQYIYEPTIYEPSKDRIESTQNRSTSQKKVRIDVDGSKKRVFDSETKPQTEAGNEKNLMESDKKTRIKTESRNQERNMRMETQEKSNRIDQNIFDQFGQKGSDQILEQTTRIRRVHKPVDLKKLNKSQKVVRKPVEEFKINVVNKIMTGGSNDDSITKPARTEGGLKQRNPSENIVKSRNVESLVIPLCDDLKKRQIKAPNPRISEAELKYMSDFRDKFYKTKSMARLELEHHPQMAVSKFSDMSADSQSMMHKVKMADGSESHRKRRNGTNSPSKDGLEGVLKCFKKKGESIRSNSKQMTPHKASDHKCCNHPSTNYHSQSDKLMTHRTSNGHKNHCCHLYLIKPNKNFGSSTTKHSFSGSNSRFTYPDNYVVQTPKKNLICVTLNTGSVLRSLMKETRCDGDH